MCKIYIFYFMLYALTIRLIPFITLWFYIKKKDYNYILISYPTWYYYVWLADLLEEKYFKSVA